MMDRFGAEHAMQNKELFDRAMTSAFRMKDVTLPNGTVLQLQGYEPQFVNFLLNVEHIDGARITMPTTTVQYVRPTGKAAHYHPDMQINGDGSGAGSSSDHATGGKPVLVEVKSAYTLATDIVVNRLKFHATAQRCDLRVVVVARCGPSVQVPTLLFDETITKRTTGQFMVKLDAFVAGVPHTELDLSAAEKQDVLEDAALEMLLEDMEDMADVLTGE